MTQPAADDEDRYDVNGGLIGSHVLKNPDDEYEVLEKLPKEVREALLNSPVNLRAHWVLLNIPKSQALRVIRMAAEETMKKRPTFRPLTDP